MKLHKAGEVTLRAALEMKFMSSYIETQMLKTPRVTCVEFVYQTKLLHAFTQRHTEHADLLATCTDWLQKHLFLLCDLMLIIHIE